jgi:uncharacterized protein DUF4054
MPVTSPCPTPTPIVPGIATFAYGEFTGIYPEFNGAAQGACSNNFTLATILLSNCCGSIVKDPNVRLSLLYMLTAHITFLNTPCPANNNQPNGIVGRIDSAAQGSVNVTAEYSSEVSQSEAYFIQTKYGAQFWQSTAGYRTMHYIPAPSTGLNGPGFPWQVGGFVGVDIE